MSRFARPAELFPTATPLCLDLMSKMLAFDQTKRACVLDCLEHPYLAELHSRAREPICRGAFDWSFEKDYPDEMPQNLLQVRKHLTRSAFIATQCYESPR